MPENKYNWIRYCSEHGTGVDANGRGWFEVEEQFLFAGSSIERLDQIGDVPCLILLGEPGEGKTKALEQLASPGNPIRLEAYTDERRLRDDLRRAFSRAEHGREPVQVFLDSLDEVLIPIRTAADVLSGELERIRPHLAEVRLRLTCRTGAWPATLEDRLRTLWERPGDVIRRTLLPLTRADVVAAARYEGINAEALVREIERADIIPLASRPATLLMLFAHYRQRERLPSSRWELYDQATRRLATEPLERDERSTAGLLLPTEHRAVAALIATTMVLGNYAKVSRRFGVAGPGELDPSLVCDWTEELEDGRRLQVNEAMVKEVLRGGLFAGTGPTRRFGHRTFGEFLCAWRLTHQSVSLEMVLDLLRAGDTLVRPQLHELAGWVAVRRRDVWEWLAENEPSVLLLGDTATASPSDREQLTEALLHLCHQRRLVDYIGGWDEHLDRLDHSELARQLTKWIIRSPDGTTKDLVARRVAFRIASACARWHSQPDSQFPSQELEQWRPFANAALSVALDSGEDHHIRHLAATTVEAVGELGLVQRLRPLLDLPEAQDPELDLKGNTLRALWKRRMLQTEEVFQHLLQQPSRSNYFGSYRSFIEFELAPNLKDDELPVALEWIAKGKSPEPRSARAVRRVIMERAWQATDTLKIQEPLVSAIVSLLETHQDLGLSSDVVEGDPGRRRTIVLAIVRAATKEYALFDLYRHSLVKPVDLPWLLDVYRTEPEGPLRKQLRLLIRYVLDLNDPKHGPLILDACAEDPLLAKELRLMEPVQLDHPDVVRQRQLAKREQERRAKKRVRSSEEVIEEQLRHTDGGAWWGLWRALAMEGDTDHLGEPWNIDSTALPGWKTANPLRQSRIRDVAERYLRSRDPQTADWLGSNQITGATLAGIAAVKIVATEPERLSAIKPNVWRRWTPALVSYGRELPDTVRTEILRQTPEIVADTFRAILEGDATSEWKAFAIEHSVDWWCPPLAALIRTLASNPLEEVIDHAVIKVLAKAEPATFTTIAWARLYQDGATVDLRANAAASLYWQLGSQNASRWWTTLNHDEALTHKVLALISKTRELKAHEQRTDIPAEIIESIYLWLMERYPPEEDPGFGTGARFLGPRDEVASFRDGLVEFLGLRASAEDLAVLGRLESRYPDRLRWTLAKARLQHRTKGWQGWAPADLQARLTEFDSAPRQLAPVSSRPPKKETGMINLDDLFPERRFPKFTYVPLPQHAAIRRVLAGAHKALLVEGPAATGKTLAVQYALDELKAPEAEYYEFLCADPADRKKLRDTLDRGIRTLGGYLVVDDVHRIDDSQLLKDLIGAVKTAVDTGKGPRCALIGTHVGIRSLLSAFPDAGNSVETVSVQASEETLRDIVIRGSLTAQVEVEGIDALVTLAGGSTQIMQLACYILFRSSQVAGKLPSRITVGVDRLRKLLLERFERPSEWVEQFVSEAGKDAAQRGVAMALLWELGQSKSTSIRRDRLSVHVPWDQRTDDLDQVFAATLSAELPFGIEHGVLSVEDLRTLFLLRNWNTEEWSELARRLRADIWFQPGSQAPMFPTREPYVPKDTSFMDWKTHRDIILRSLRCKDFHENVYLLGSTESRVTFYAQQCRALSLIHALLDSEELTEGSKLGVVGGGLSGMTAAVAAAQKGCQVTLYEKEGSLMPRQAAASHRWVHPLIYDAQTLPGNSNSGLPVLPWNAGPASEVVEQIRLRTRPEITFPIRLLPEHGCGKANRGEV